MRGCVSGYEENPQWKGELLHSITKQKSFDSACRIVEDYIMKIFKLLSDMNSSTGQRQARLAMNYIQKNYMDPDLSLRHLFLSEYQHQLLQYNI